MGSGRGRVVKSVRVLLHYFITIQVIECWRIVYGSHVGPGYTFRSSLKVEVIECLRIVYGSDVGPGYVS